MIVDELVSLFLSSPITINELENEALYEGKFEGQALNLPDNDKLLGVIKRFPGDLVVVDIKVGSQSPVTISNTESDFNAFNAELKKSIRYKDAEDKTAIQVSINKNIDTIIHLYRQAIFWEYVFQLPYFDLTALFAHLFQNRSLLIFRCLDLTRQQTRWSTRTLRIIGSDDPLPAMQPTPDRSELWRKIKEVCHYGNSAEINLLPEDFYLLQQPDDTKNKEFLDRLCIAQVITVLFDITRDDADGVDYKLNGMRLQSGLLKFQNIDTGSLQQLFQIAQWVYDGGNLSDKIGLARNILSIHIIDKNTMTLEGSPFESIKSGFDVYLKQNIKQYIEVRNKMSEQLTDFNKKATQIIDNFASGFQKSSLAVLTFFSTVVVAKVLSKSATDQIFTFEAYELTLLFIFGSVLYLIVSIREVEAQRRRFINTYFSMKARYTDLLDAADIEKILNNDQDFNQDLNFLDERRNLYRNLWIAVLGLIFLISTILHVFYVLTPPSANSH